MVGQSVKALMPSRRASSCSTSTPTKGAPTWSRIWTVTEEKPQRGESGVPFMKSTTSCSATVWAMKAWTGSAAVCSVTVSEPFCEARELGAQWGRVKAGRRLGAPRSDGLRARRQTLGAFGQAGGAVLARGLGRLGQHQADGAGRLAGPASAGQGDARQADLLGRPVQRRGRDRGPHQPAPQRPFDLQQGRQVADGARARGFLGYALFV